MAGTLVRGVRGVALVAVRSPREPRAVLPGDRGLPAVFVVQLLIYGFHELTEANLFPYSEPLHWATDPYGPDGRYGQYLTYLLALPMGWLAFAALFGGRKNSVPSPVQQTARRGKSKLTAKCEVTRTTLRFTL